MKKSAGLLLYRSGPKGFEVLLVHPGRPFWAKKDRGAWSIPKGEFVDGEEALTAAKREFSEETGLAAPETEYISLGDMKQSSGKLVSIWATEADLDLKQFKSNEFEMEWPPKSGRIQAFAECDKAAWVDIAVSRTKLVKGQVVFVGRLAERIGITLAQEPRQDQISLF